MNTQTGRRNFLMATSSTIDQSFISTGLTCDASARRNQGEFKDEALALARRQMQFQTLAARIRRRIYNVANRALYNPQDAEDVTQEALVRAWANFERFDPSRSFEAWVFRIANNLIIDHNRRRRRRPEIPLDAPAVAGLDGNEGARCPELSDSTGDPEACLMAREISEALQSALYSLPPLQQATILLVEQQPSYEQMARTLGCAVGTVRSRVHRARALLQHNLKESAI